MPSEVLDSAVSPRPLFLGCELAECRSPTSDRPAELETVDYPSATALALPPWLGNSLSVSLTTERTESMRSRRLLTPPTFALSGLWKAWSEKKASSREAASAWLC